MVSLTHETVTHALYVYRMAIKRNYQKCRDRSGELGFTQTSVLSVSTGWKLSCLLLVGCLMPTSIHGDEVMMR